MSLFGVFLISIFPYLDWIRTRETPNTAFFYSVEQSYFCRKFSENQAFFNNLLTKFRYCILTFIWIVSFKLSNCFSLSFFFSILLISLEKPLRKIWSHHSLFSIAPLIFLLILRSISIYLLFYFYYYYYYFS